MSPIQGKQFGLPVNQDANVAFRDWCRSRLEDGSPRVRIDSKQILDVAEACFSTLSLFLGAGDRQGQKYGALPPVSRPVLTKIFVRVSLEKGWWRICGRYWRCKDGRFVCLQIPDKSGGLSRGSAARAVYEASVFHFLSAFCPACETGATRDMDIFDVR